MNIIEVVAAIIFDSQNRVLLARRKPTKILGGKWEFPGGKVNDQEDHYSALEREIAEEMGVKIKTIDFIGSNLHHYESVSIHLFAYSCQYLSGKYELTDHDAISWVEIDKLNDFDLAPADIPLIEKLKSKYPTLCKG